MGRVALEANGRLIDDGRLPGRQGRLLFAYLAAAQSRPVPRDELAEAIWGEAPPATWEKGLTVVVSKLRSVLAERRHRLDERLRLLPARIARRELGRRRRGVERSAGCRGGACGGRPRASQGRCCARRLIARATLPAGGRGGLGRTRTARARRRAGPGAQRAGRRLPALGRCGGGRGMGRADDLAHAVSRNRLPPTDGGPRRRRQSGRSTPRVREVPAAARRRAGNVPLSRDRVDLPHAPRSAHGAGPAAANSRLYEGPAPGGGPP